MGIRRFFILGRARTGSTLLQTLLDSHSQITVFGELFARYGLPGWGIEPVLKSPKAVAMIRQDPVGFLEKHIFSSIPEQLAASDFKPNLRLVGFKLFYDQAREGAWRSLWSYLGQTRDYKVIHIKRKNILKTYLSQKRAQATGAWISRINSGEEGSAPELRFHLSYDECLKIFNYTREQEIACDQIFAEHYKLNIYYEDLARDHEAAITCVQNFLDVCRENLRPFTQKQACRPISSEIENYWELKERFKDTPWAEFFID